MEGSFTELAVFKAPKQVLTTDRARTASAYRPEVPQAKVQGWADSLNYVMDSYDASHRVAPYLPRGVRPIRHSNEFQDTLHHWLHEMLEAVKRTAPPKKAEKETKAEAAIREEAEAEHHANLLRHLDNLVAQRNAVVSPLIYTKVQKRPGGGLVEAGSPGRAVLDRAWELFEGYIAATKAELERSPFAVARRQELDRQRKRKFAIAALVLGGVAMIGLLIAVTLYLAKRPAAPQMLPLPIAYPPPHHRRPVQQPPSPNPPQLVAPQPAINPILLGYNPGIQESLSIQTPFSPTPLYSYPA